MAVIGLLAHTGRDSALDLANQTARWLAERGHEAVFLDPESGDRRPGASTSEAGHSEAGQLDLAVSLGGDGTMLRTVDLVSRDGVPVLGVNLGQLGYLTAVEPESLRDALAQFLAGDYRIESRVTLDVSVTDVAGDGSHMTLHRSALNDLVVQRPAGGHTVRAEVAVNKVPFLTFVADSLIVATPTGSTAYNLSARGPIISPRARVLVLTSVAPHMLFDRSLVLDAEDSISISPTAGTPADVVVDGWRATVLRPGHTLHCRRGDQDALLVTFGERDFHDILKRKFNLADR